MQDESSSNQPHEADEAARESETEPDAPEASAEEELRESGRKPPPDDLTEDPAYEPPDELKGYKGA